MHSSLRHFTLQHFTTVFSVNHCTTLYTPIQNFKIHVMSSECCPLSIQEGSWSSQAPQTMSAALNTSSLGSALSDPKYKPFCKTKYHHLNKFNVINFVYDS